MKKNSLPDSLELLLDTMCNTFGGIMFIAISLIIVSQLITRTLQSVSPEELDRRRMQQMAQAIEQYGEENQRLRHQVLQAQLNTDEVSPDRKEVLEEVLAVRKQTLDMQNRQEILMLQNQGKQLEIRQMKQKYWNLQKEYLTLKESQKQRRANAEVQWRLLSKQVADLTQKLQHMHPRELRFSLEKETVLAPYWVLLKNNKLYRFGLSNSPLPGEVTAENSGWRQLRLIPVRGTSLSGNASEELKYLFRDVSKIGSFVYLVTDYESVPALLLAKQYLRNAGFQVGWMVNPQFLFFYGNNVSYRASE